MPTATPGTPLSNSEIKGLHKELSKAIGGDVKKDITVLLDRLKEGVVPSEDVIRSTKIGQLVGKLRNHADADVAGQAKALVQGWKAVIDQEREKKGGAGAGSASGSTSASGSASAKKSTSNSNNTSSNSNSASAATAPASSAASTSSRGGSSTPNVNNNTATAGSASPPSATPASASPSTTTAAPPSTNLPPSTGKKPDFTTLNDKTRNACLKVIFDALKTADVKEVDESQLFAISLDVEASVFARLCPAEEVTAEYRNKIRSLSLNLKDKNNPSFRRRVVRGELAASTLVDLTPKEMASEERLAEYRSLEQQNMLVAQSAAEQEAETDAFQCGRCKQRKCRYYQKQTRSADEPMTTFVTCTNCNNKWKFC